MTDNYSASCRQRSAFIVGGAVAMGAINGDIQKNRAGISSPMFWLQIEKAEDG